MSHFVKDATLWNAYYATIGNYTPGGRTAEEAAKNVGNCVKSIERDDTGFPKYHGRLAKYTEKECVVIMSDILHDMLVWTGTQNEYHQTWIVD